MNTNTETNTETNANYYSNAVYEEIIKACLNDDLEGGIYHSTEFIENPDIYTKWYFINKHEKTKMCHCVNTPNILNNIFHLSKCNCVKGKRYMAMKVAKDTQNMDLFNYLFEHTFSSKNNTYVSNLSDGQEISNLLIDMAAINIMLGRGYSKPNEEFCDHYRKKFNITKKTTNT